MPCARGGRSPEEPGAAGPTEPELPEPDPVEMQLKVDFFRKLGYSSAEILVVLQKLGLSADTNTVLGELVKQGVEREAAQDALEPPPPPPQRRSPAPAGPSEGKEGENLRPVVVDGSNVAMRFHLPAFCPCQDQPHGTVNGTCDFLDAKYYV